MYPLGFTLYPYGFSATTSLIIAAGVYLSVVNGGQGLKVLITSGALKIIASDLNKSLRVGAAYCSYKVRPTTKALNSKNLRQVLLVDEPCD
jgi:hypothetical protein